MGCGKSKHVAIENTISRKNSISGSKLSGENPEIVAGKASKRLDRNASSLTIEEAEDVVGPKNPKAEIAIEETGQLDPNVSTLTEKKGTCVVKTVTGSGEGKIPEIAIQETSELNRNVSTLTEKEGTCIVKTVIGSGEGEIRETAIEETSKLDRNVSSLVKKEGKSVNQDPIAENSKAIVDEIDMVKSMESNEHVEETSKADDITQGR